MSWWVYLQDKDAEPWCSYGKDVEDACLDPCYPSVAVTRFSAGGTRMVGGNTSAELNVTYNYGGIYRRVFEGKGFREFLDGRSGAEALPFLKAAVEDLGTEEDNDYWKPTDGNAGAALKTLASWAEQYPDAVFHVS